MSTVAIGRLIRSRIESRDRVLLVLVGSNGAGKTTFYEKALVDCALPFVNADNIAEGRAFIMETVLSDPYGAKLDFMRCAMEAGYFLIVVYIRLENVQVSTTRVMQRVAEGGHDVPDKRLAARFPRTMRNAAEAVKMAQLAVILDNSVVGQPYRWVETWKDGVRVDQDTPGFQPFPA